MNRSVPVHPVVPPVGAVLAAVAAVLETAGLAVRLFEVRGDVGRLLSMDGPGSLPTLFAAGVLTGAAVVAVVGARRIPARRRWWSAVAVVAGSLAAAKATGVPYARLIGSSPTDWRASVVLGCAAGAGLLILWRLSGTDRRDRRRILAVLAAHASAVIGLSAVSQYARVTGGAVPAAFATFVEESGAALTAAALLVAVLVGVLPRAVLPAGTVLRRRDDQPRGQFRVPTRIAA